MAAGGWRRGQGRARDQDTGGWSLPLAGEWKRCGKVLTLNDFSTLQRK